MTKTQHIATPLQSLALLQGITEDYARLLKSSGNEATAGLVAGVSRETVRAMESDLRELELIKAQLRTLQAEHEKRQEITNRIAKADTEILPQTLEIEVGK